MNSDVLPSSSLLDTIALPVQYIDLVHSYLGGSTIDELALKYNLEPVKITEFLDRKEVKLFINKKMDNYKYLNLTKRIDLLSDMVEQKVQKATDTGDDLTAKDLLDVMKLLREEARDLKNSQGESSGDEAKNTYVNIINQLKA